MKLASLFRSLISGVLLFSGLVHAASDARNLQVGAAGNRVALVIGNDSYSGVPALRNARADARAIAAALARAGYRTEIKLDLNEKAMKAALRDFKRSLSGGDEAVFFFAGHGVQLGAANYLLPVDIKGDNEDQVKDEAIPLQRILDDLQEQKVKFTLAIIDACRDNPFKGSGRSIGGRGLAPTTAATGQMVIFSAGTGQQALDRLGANDRQPNGLFTRVFLKEMEKPGVPVDRVLKSVRQEVARLAADVKHEQVPALYDQALGEFYFHPGRATELAALASPPSGARTREQIEDELWDAIKDSNKGAVFDQYLAQYPNGRYVALARVKLLELKASPQQRLAAPSATPVASGSPGAPGTGFKDCADCPEMVVIPAGSFEMGSTHGEPEETPVHTVRIARPFAMAKTEITRGQFADFVAASGYSPGEGCRVWTGSKWETQSGRSWRDPGYAQTNSHPVACVSWDDARAYVAWLSAKTGRLYRLPNEAEWEYTARSRTTSSRPWGDNPDDACRHANVADRTMNRQVAGASGWPIHNCDDGQGHTAPVGSYGANGFGVHDMIGNVWEWTADCWNERYDGAPADGSAWQSGNCTRRVVRGGSWSYKPQGVRSASRSGDSATARIFSSGFRPVREFP